MPTMDRYGTESAPAGAAGHRRVGVVRLWWTLVGPTVRTGILVAVGSPCSRRWPCSLGLLTQGAGLVASWPALRIPPAQAADLDRQAT